MTLPALLPDWLRHRAAVTPDRTALVADGRSWSFAELDADVQHAARQLASHGVRAGDRVATLLGNGHRPVVLAHAVLRLHATLVPLNFRLSTAELTWQVADASPRVVIVDERTSALLGTLERDRSEVAIVSADALVGSRDATRDATRDTTRDATRDAALHHAHDPSHVLAIIYTSGTTGRPKGAMLTVGNFWWSAIGSALHLGSHADDRWLAALPLFHIGGLSIVMRSAICGITADVHDGFDAAAVNRAIDDDGVTLVSVVAVMLQRMLDARGEVPYPATLRCVLLGGGPAPRPLLERCVRLGVPVAQTYGLSESTSQVATLLPEDALRKPGSAGRALYPNELRITVDAGMDADVGEPGEIQVRGPIVMAGYAGQPEASARAIVDGWLHTGDVGRIDADGYLHVLDRRDDLIISGGENVYPAEVEAALLSHLSVADAGVVGAPDAQWGQRVVAVVQLSPSADANDGSSADVLRAHCRSLLAGYKCPAEFHVSAAPLPRTASGKLRRAELRDRLGLDTAPRDAER